YRWCRLGQHCGLEAFNTTGSLIYNNRTGTCYKDYGAPIAKFDTEKSVSEIRSGSIFCQCFNSSICATQPETFDKLKAVARNIKERTAAELVANFLRTGAIAIKGKDTLPDFRTTTTTPTTTTEPVTSTTTIVTTTTEPVTSTTTIVTTATEPVPSTTTIVTTTTEAVTPEVKVVTDINEISTIALKAAQWQECEEKCSSCGRQELSLVGLGILCLILIAIIIVLVIKNRGMQHKLKKRDLERGARTTSKDLKSSGSSENKSAPTGIKSAGSGSADRTVGSKESGSKEKAGSKSVTGGEKTRSKE
ncbi:hypothetical protein GCK32_006595, partial [Trichostrongylus colubriformis]